MAKKTGEHIETESCKQRSRLWHDGVWDLSGGLALQITLAALRKKVTVFDVPEKVVIPCLTTFRMEGLIMCIDKEGREIAFSNKPADYTQFILTPKGSNLGPNYAC